MSVISIRNVRKSYGKVQVVHGVNLEIAHGEFIVILGPSGCGKSTLLRMVAGLEAISEGEIAIGGTVVNKMEPRERGCAMVFQNYALYPHMTVAENIGYALKVAGVGKAERDKRIAEVANVLALGELLDRKPGQMSGGQRQRVAMGRAMIREPKVFLYDEPLSNLDAKLRVAMRIEIRKLHRRIGATSIFVTHDQVEALTLADRIVVMNRGVIEQIGAPREIYLRPSSTYVGGFIGTPGMSFVGGTVDASAGVIRLAHDQTFPLDRARFPQIADQKVTVGLRAENVHVVDAGFGIRTAFEFTEEMGSGQLVHCQLGSEMLVAHTRDVVHRPVGEPVYVSVAAQDVHLFDATTGKRLPEVIAAESHEQVQMMAAI